MNKQIHSIRLKIEIKRFGEYKIRSLLAKWDLNGRPFGLADGGLIIALTQPAEPKRLPL